MEVNSSYRKFRILGIATIIAVYFLILVGGIVRSTGSGMGCPDWPKCFGSFVPPTQVNELPENYKEIYVEKRKLKNAKIASVLSALNFKTLSTKLLHDQSIYEELDFNVTKTWIEYLNRLVGVIIGLLIFAFAVYSFLYYNSDRIIFYLSLLSVLLVGFEGWLGSIVVSTNLLPFTITIHMALALILVAVLIYVVVRLYKSQLDQVSKYYIDNNTFLLVLLSITFIQILAGTQVREQVDIVAELHDYSHREIWVEELGNVFYFHRSFSILIALLNFYYFRKIILTRAIVSFYDQIGLAIVSTLILEILFGIILSYFDIPAFSQPIHLLLGCLLLGLQLILYTSVVFSRKVIEKDIV